VYSVVSCIVKKTNEMFCIVRPAAGEKRLSKEQPPLFRTNVMLVIPNIVRSLTHSVVVITGISCVAVSHKTDKSRSLPFKIIMMFIISVLLLLQCFC